MTVTEQQAQEQLPSGWKMMRIIDIALYAQIGDARVTEDLAIAKGPIALIVSGDLNNAKEFQISKYVTPEILQEKVLKELQNKKHSRKNKIVPVLRGEGTVLVALARERAGTVSMLNAEKAVFNNAVYAITPDPRILRPELLFYYLRNPGIRSQIKKTSMPSTKSYASVGSFKKLSIPIPPMSQQESLIKRIEALLSNVERTQRLLKKNQANIDQLLASALRDIFVPSRVAQWHHTRLGDLVTIDTAIQSSDYPLDEGDQPYIESSDINPTLAFIAIDRKKSMHTLPDTKLSILANNSDVIVYSKLYNKEHWQSRVAMPYRDSNTFLLSNISGFKYSSDLYQLLVSDTSRILPRFLFWSLLAPQFTQAVIGKGSPARLTISEDNLQSYEVFFPDREKQEHISTYLDDVQKKVREMSIRQTASMQAIEGMEESILNQAFLGKL